MDGGPIGLGVAYPVVAWVSDVEDPCLHIRTNRRTTVMPTVLRIVCKVDNNTLHVHVAYAHKSEVAVFQGRR
jgi:hypothetical protein